MKIKKMKQNSQIVSNDSGKESDDESESKEESQEDSDDERGGRDWVIIKYLWLYIK